MTADEIVSKWPFLASVVAVATGLKALSYIGTMAHTAFRSYDQLVTIGLDMHDTKNTLTQIELRQQRMEDRQTRFENQLGKLTKNGHPRTVPDPSGSKFIHQRKEDKEI